MALTVLILGDVVGRIGRQAVARVLPAWKERHQPDLTLANAENLAHGVGITAKTVQDLLGTGVDFLTSGNHVFDKAEGIAILNDPASPIIRPANYPPGTPGRGIHLLDLGAHRVLVVNLQGRVFMREELDDPFRTLDRLLQERANEKLSAILVDLHAEATSEKVAFGWYADGRASAVYGTHTHIETADAKILPGGTAYLTDVGMTGALHSVIGVDKNVILRKFLTQLPAIHEMPEAGPAIVNGLLVRIDPETKKALAIERLTETVIID